MPGEAPGLSVSDRKILGQALDAGRALERALLLSNSEISLAESKFRGCLLALAKAESPLVQKQAEYAAKVDATLGERHLFTLLVPLERLLNRAARDEEFLYAEGDRTSLDPESLALKSRLPRVVICENLRSAFNVGAIFRTGECFLANEIWLTGYTAPPSKTAMGTDELVPWKSVAHSRDAISEAKSLGYKVVALELTNDAVPLEEFTWPEKTALLIGNERFGVDSETLKSCDVVIKIPTNGLKNSLNVGVAFGIAAAAWRNSKGSTAPTSKELPTSERAKLIQPIGYVKGGYTSPQTAPRQGSYLKFDGDEATVLLEGKFEGKPANFEQALKDLEGFSHVWLVFGFHLSKSWLPQTKPPRGDGSLKGVFATRAPHRPNGLGLSCVRLLGIEGRSVRISHHDLLDGTPIYDIKPYVPEADSFPDARAGWIDLLPPPHSIEESAIAKEKLDWLEAEGEARLRPFIFEQLRYQPLDQTRKRIEIVPAVGDDVSVSVSVSVPVPVPDPDPDSDPDSTARSSTASELESAETQFTASFRTWRIHATFTRTTPIHTTCTNSSFIHTAPTHADLTIAALSNTSSVSKSGSAASASGAVKIHDISSGYSRNELSDSTDIYGDKDLHRRFLSRFGDRLK